MTLTKIWVLFNIAHTIWCPWYQPHPVIRPAQTQQHIDTISSRSGGTVPVIWQDFEVTWYTPEGGWGSGLITKSGKPVEEGTTIAVDPSIVPLGSTVAIQFRDGSVHEFTAEDTGSAIRGHHIDIFVWSEQQAIRNGREVLKVAILQRGNGHE